MGTKMYRNHFRIDIVMQRGAVKPIRIKYKIRVGYKSIVKAFDVVELTKNSISLRNGAFFYLFSII